ncbi:MAG: flagellar motor switch protein FliG, partial [Litoricola sp.]|nr:flagellar motor switch protein FliG [Litorivicinus sp.]
MAQEADLSNLPEVLREEIEGLTQADRAAVLLLLLGEDEAANILKYMNPSEVQRLGAAMVSAADLSQEAINYVLDEFVSTLK